MGVMEHTDHLRAQIARYQRLIVNVNLESVAVARVQTALTELEQQLRLERGGTSRRAGALQSGYPDLR